MMRLGLCCIFRNEPIRFRTTTAAAIKCLPRDEGRGKLADLCGANAQALPAALRFCSAHSRCKPLVSHEVIVNLIANTTTQNGLTIKVELDTRQYETRIKVSDAELATLHLRKARFHGDWNHIILPR